METINRRTMSMLLVSISIIFAVAMSHVALSNPTPRVSGANTAANNSLDFAWQIVSPPKGWESLVHGVAFNEIEATSDGSVWLSAGRSVVHLSNQIVEIQRMETITQSIRALSMVSATEGWGAGRNGVPVRFDGAKWRDFPSPVANVRGTSFGAIEMVSATDGWLCLQSARFEPPIPSTLLRFDGEAWDFYPFPEGRSCFAIAMASPTDGWIVGSRGAMAHFDGIEWRDIPGPTTETIRDVDMVSPTEGWAVANSGKQNGGSSILHYDGEAWEIIPPVTNESLAAIDFISPNEGWAVGDTVLHYTHGTWEEVEIPVSLDEENDHLRAVKIVSANDVWAAGINGLILRYGPTPGGGPSLSGATERISLPMLTVE